MQDDVATKQGRFRANWGKRIQCEGVCEQDINDAGGRVATGHRVPGTVCGLWMRHYGCSVWLFKCRFAGISDMVCACSSFRFSGTPVKELCQWGALVDFSLVSLGKVFCHGTHAGGDLNRSPGKHKKEKGHITTSTGVIISPTAVID